MPPITLSKDPKHKELEEFVSSFFQSHGYYIERNIIEREIEEVLELDIIITDYQLDLTDIRLIEVKSSKWGFHDIFKVRGWMDYLSISNALLITDNSKGGERDDFCKQKAEGLTVDLIIIPNLEQTADCLQNYAKEEQIDEIDIRIWRYSYWIERNMIKHIIHKKKSNKNINRYNILSNYYHTVNSSIFFEENLIDRVFHLYMAFQDNPRISAKCSHEMIGEDFDGDHRILPEQIFDDTYFQGKYNDFQISTLEETRAC